jgi:predicted lipoprotein with Yx(FWY)xxD motif
MRCTIRKSLSVLAVVALTMAASACGDDDDAVSSEDSTTDTADTADPVAAAEARVEAGEAGVAESAEALTAAHGEFCTASEGYVEVLDRYGRVFTDSAATVGDIRTLGADLTEPRDEVVSAADAVSVAKDDLAAAQQELIEAQAALAAAIASASSVPNDTATATSTTTTTIVAPATIERVQQAEDDLARVSSGITDETPLVEAAADFNSAALSLEIAWLVLLDDADCLTDEQQATAVELVTAYTTALQTDLRTAGYDPGAIDGVYGPSTVAAVEQLQTDSELRVTGFVDEFTARALQERLAAVGQEQATQTIQVQTILTLAGYWDGPVDGVWTDELTQALMEFQTALGVEPTGVVDAATIAAFQLALANLQAGAPPTTAAATPETTAAPATGGEATVLVAESALGPIITAGDGMTVYLFVSDAQGTPTCTDACGEVWPPLKVDDADQVAAGDGVDASLLDTVEHPDAGTQVTYNDWPLYLFTGDSAPGDINGQGQGGVWYVLDATGEPIDD